MPLLAEHRTEVAVVYASYLISALLLILITLMPARVFRTVDNVLIRVGAGFRLWGGSAKMLGIECWLFIIPTISANYTEPQTTPTAREAISITFDAFNASTLRIGEVISVMLLARLSTVLIRWHCSSAS